MTTGPCCPEGLWSLHPWRSPQSDQHKPMNLTSWIFFFLLPFAILCNLALRSCFKPCLSFLSITSPLSVLLDSVLPLLELLVVSHDLPSSSDTPYFRARHRGSKQDQENMHIACYKYHFYNIEMVLNTQQLLILKSVGRYGL